MNVPALVPIFSLATASSDVVALLGKGSTVRLYLFGEAPAQVAKPYVVWQLVGGSPENLLAGVPNLDNYQVQLDVYADSAAVARQVQRALMAAYEPQAYVVSYNFEMREPDTRLYRVCFTVEFMTPRDVSS